MNQLFNLVIELLSSAERENSDITFVRNCLEILDEILSWDFTHADDSLAGGSNSKDEDLVYSISSSFPETWREVFTGCSMTGLFCQIQTKYGGISADASHVSMQCLIHLSGVCGPVFSLGVSRAEQDTFTLNYLESFLNQFLQLLDGYNQFTYIRIDSMPSKLTLM
jgi:hypothetical protein